MRQDLANFYAFCRFSDDLGDKGNVDTAAGKDTALKNLDAWDNELDQCFQGNPQHPIYIALKETIDKYHLPPEPFRDLISAFKQDQVKQRYETFEELLDYCRRSANPVGRIYLMLFGFNESRRFELSDKICTALQLANFWQDASIDLKLGRIYLPAEDLKMFGVCEDDLFDMNVNESFKRLINYECERTEVLFKEGAKLESILPRRIAFEVRLFRRGGEMVLKKIKKLNYDVLTRRPVIGKANKAGIFLKALFS